MIDRSDYINYPQRNPETVAAVLRRRLADNGEMEIPVTGPSMGRMITSGSTVTVVDAQRPRPGEVWAVVDDAGIVVIHLVRHVLADGVIGRGSANDLDDAPVKSGRVVGRVVSAEDSSGVTSMFGERSRVTRATLLRLRHLARLLLRSFRQRRFWPKP